MPLLASVITKVTAGVVLLTDWFSPGNVIETVGLVVSTLKFLVSEPLFPARSV
ncbi:MAG: hypothetical protein Q7V62_02275 [Actinomycetota bacterium]|nr:hypothetical protein [Actinomycetota bacterium]